MRTHLPASIKTVPEAIDFLTALNKNGESYHPEDDATTIDWDLADKPTLLEETQLNNLMADIYCLPGNDGRHTKLAFDPCEYLLLLDRSDNEITVDGEATTIGKYMADNEWETISHYMGSVSMLELDEDYIVPVGSGFIIIKRLTE